MKNAVFAMNAVNAILLQCTIHPSSNDHLVCGWADFEYIFFWHFTDDQSQDVCALCWRKIFGPTKPLEVTPTIQLHYALKQIEQQQKTSERVCDNTR